MSADRLFESLLASDCDPDAARLRHIGAMLVSCGRTTHLQAVAIVSAFREKLVEWRNEKDVWLVLVYPVPTDPYYDEPNVALSRGVPNPSNPFFMCPSYFSLSLGKMVTIETKSRYRAMTLLNVSGV